MGREVKKLQESLCEEGRFPLAQQWLTLVLLCPRMWTSLENGRVTSQPWVHQQKVSRYTTAACPASSSWDATPHSATRWASGTVPSLCATMIVTTEGSQQRHNLVEAVEGVRCVGSGSCNRDGGSQAHTQVQADKMRRQELRYREERTGEGREEEARKTERPQAEIR
ncbi:hypothetical protein WMY93_020481 [Mugilogobius chulae]|uniref:Uncharacterized protein n=1 Tax=Mugilogobius chulae TaxID=88201 RepID=A0AAW0NK08_9GOBI